MKNKIENLAKEMSELSEFFMERAKEAHKEWKLSDADTWRTQAIHYKHFHEKLEGILGDT